MRAESARLSVPQTPAGRRRQCPHPRLEATAFLLPRSGCQRIPDSKNPRTSASQETIRVISPNRIPAQESFHAVFQPLSELPSGREAHYLTRSPFSWAGQPGWLRTPLLNLSQASLTQQKSILPFRFLFLPQYKHVTEKSQTPGLLL